MRKNTVPNFPMFGASGVSMATNQTSIISNILQMDNIGIYVSWSGTSPTGSLVVEISPDYILNGPNTATWYPLDFGTTIAVSGNSGNDVININQNPGTWIRMRYVAAAGTGIITASLSMKSVGA